jgi:hypothetical protein
MFELATRSHDGGEVSPAVALVAAKASASNAAIVIFMYRGDRNLALYLPRLAFLVSIEADRPGAWFPGPLSPYAAWFPGIELSRDFERVKVPGNPMKKSVLFLVSFGAKFLRSLFARVDSRIT